MPSWAWSTANSCVPHRPRFGEKVMAPGEGLEALKGVLGFANFWDFLWISMGFLVVFSRGCFANICFFVFFWLFLTSENVFEIIFTESQVRGSQRTCRTKTRSCQGVPKFPWTSLTAQAQARTPRQRRTAP